MTEIDIAEIKVLYLDSICIVSKKSSETGKKTFAINEGDEEGPRLEDLDFDEMQKVSDFLTKELGE